MSDRVWLWGHAEAAHSGVDPVDVYESMPRQEWEAMTPAEQGAYLDDVGGSALERIASYGASVVDESDVPESERDDR